MGKFKHLLIAGLLALAFSAPATAATPLDGDAMWVWIVRASQGGDPDRMAAKAAKHNVRTVIIKAADGRLRFPQFSSTLVARLKAHGLRVCAYQRVKGLRPRTEAERLAEAARKGADCLVIDAESELEGRYAAAQAYMKRLRARVGPDFPLALTSFPYVNLHPRFPYSVFLGPGGAQVNLPQMYWKTIGVSVDRIFTVAYTQNRVYERPIYPLGQVYLNPRGAEVRRFRRLAQAYGAPGVSWWVWQHARTPQWTALGSAFEPIGSPRITNAYPVLKYRYRSDQVIWAQQHLKALGLITRVSGRFGSGTRDAVLQLQADNGLRQTGRIDAAVWQRLLAVEPAPVRWIARQVAIRRQRPCSARARSISRFWSLALRSRRLSTWSLPFARAISTFARAPLK